MPLGEASGGMLRGAGFEGASSRFIRTFKKSVFQQKFRPKYAKNAYFLKKRL